MTQQIHLVILYRLYDRTKECWVRQHQPSITPPPAKAWFSSNQLPVLTPQFRAGVGRSFKPGRSYYLDPSKAVANTPTCIKYFLRHRRYIYFLANCVEINVCLFALFKKKLSQKPICLGNILPNALRDDFMCT